VSSSTRGRGRLGKESPWTYKGGLELIPKGGRETVRKNLKERKRSL